MAVPRCRSRCRHSTPRPGRAIPGEWSRFCDGDSAEKAGTTTEKVTSQLGEFFLQNLERCRPTPAIHLQRRMRCLEFLDRCFGQYAIDAIDLERRVIRIEPIERGLHPESAVAIEHHLRCSAGGALAGQPELRGELFKRRQKIGTFLTA